MDNKENKLTSNSLNIKAAEIDYNIDDCSVPKAREVTIKCNGKRFRIFLEIVTSCFGNCTGCSLSYNDRRNLTPEMSIEQVRKTLNYFVPIVNSKENLRTTVVNLGTGDYFLMDEPFLEELFKSVRLFFDSLNTPRNVLTISTSLFLNEAKMASKIGAIKKHLHGSQFAVEGVVDPLALINHYERYVENYKSLIKHFPFFDLVVNISKDVEPIHIKRMSEFLTEMNILNFDLQYAINKTNTYRVKTSQKSFSDLMDTIYDVLGEKAHDLLEISIAMPEKNKDSTTVFEEMMKNAREIMRERVMVKSNGDIYPIGFGYGDIFLDDRFDFKRVGTIDSEWDEEYGAKLIFEFLKSIYLKHRECHTCEYSKQCYGTGYAFYNIFNETKSCENVGLNVFKRICD